MEIYGNSQIELLTALAIFVISWILIFLFKKIFLVTLEKAAKKTKTQIDNIIVEILKGLGWPVYAWISLYVSTNFLQMPEWYNEFMDVFILLVLAYYLVKSFNKVVEFTVKQIIQKREEKDEHDNAILSLLSKFIRSVVWLFAVLFVLSNFGFEVTTFLAGIGIGGIAIALALQGVLTDLFASLSIYLDKPFKVGDFILVGPDSGVVQTIGIKSTRIKTLQGQELVISNKELVETRVHNFKKMDKRRIVFNLGVTYETPTAKLKKIPKIIENVYKSVEDADLDRVHFKSFDDFALTYEIVYFVNTNDYTRYMEIQQNVNLEIKEQFEKQKIDMAYPTQTLYLKK
ncbi:MAG: mechanosensitive ion channel family protein [Candidatus Woesearchaeota archaeon]